MKKNKLINFLVSLAVLFSPLVASAALVPCGTSEHPEVCTLCHFIVGIKNIIDWGMGILTFVAIGAIVLAGIFYIISAGNQDMMTKAKNILIQTLTGFAIVLGAWLIVTYSMYVIGASNKSGVMRTNGAWYEFTCDTVSNQKAIDIGSIPTTPTTPTTPITPSVPVVPSGTASQLAQQILDNDSIILASTGDCSDANGVVVSPLRNIQDMANTGTTIACNSTCDTSNTPCSRSVSLSDSLLQTLINMSNSRGYTISSIAGGQHETSSLHYSGRAVDANPHTNEMVNLFLSSGANRAFCDLNGDNVSCSVANHVHASF